MKLKIIITLLTFSLLSLFLITYKINFKSNNNVLLQCEREYKDRLIRVLDINSKKEKWIVVPKFVRVKKFKLLQISEIIYKVEIETFEVIPKQIKDNIIFAIFFQGTENFIITCGIGPSPYRSPAPFRSGNLQGGIYTFDPNIMQPKWVAPLIGAKIKGNKLVFDFRARFLQKYLSTYKNKKEFFINETKFAVYYFSHKFKVYYPLFGFVYRYTLVDGIDFLFPYNQDIIYMTCGVPTPLP